ncbi:hypothetical protein BKG77_20405 [Mycobacteroides chelonae]|uniref:hypothetical protein n=1 Tax=Mycobacteroides chelonae TaxID=1774 RepID=UPI0008A85D2E|nr:hypothetical protein [Mycobacteroides chelonae]OHU25638.1 hypothetical protein BKG77_20405 [Mycobacteroides chelonae]OHU61503.1 hypothetical protein BKG85_21075 [Mycobacteroides chelonae]
MAVYLLIALGALLLLLMVVRVRRRRAPEAPAPRTTVRTDDDRRRQLLARLAWDMRAPAARAVRTVAALRDTAASFPAPPAIPTPEREPDEVSWAPL